MKVKINEVVFVKTEPLLRDYVLKPIIAAAYDYAVAALAKRYPELKI